MFEATSTQPKLEDASTPVVAKSTRQKQATLEPSLLKAQRGVTARAVYVVLRANDEVHSSVMAAFRALGGSVDRWQPADKRHMAEALTRAEDALEMRRGRRDELTSALRSIRRQLEAEVWP